MPRKEYKTITIKASFFDRLMKEKSRSNLENTKFLQAMLKAYKIKQKNQSSHIKIK
jgi:hypothetical protein